MQNSIIKKIVLTLITSALLLGNDYPTAEVVAKFDKRPANLAISKDGRVFVSMHPLINPKTKLVEVKGLDIKKIYPNKKYSDGDKSKIKATIGVKVDKKNRLWILDMGANKIVAWDIKKNKRYKTINIPKNVLTKHSFLQDFALDEKRNRIIIADMTQGDLKSAPKPAFVVVNTKTGKSRRIAENHPSMMADKKGGFALNPIAIDPKFKWVYFGAVHGKKVYRVPAHAFSSDKKVRKSIKEYAPKPYSDGIAVDKNQNVYITDIETNTLGVSNKDGYKTIAGLPKGNTWPDGFAIHNNYLYATINQLDKTAALNSNGKEEGVAPFLIVRTKITK